MKRIIVGPLSLSLFILINSCFVQIGNDDMERYIALKLVAVDWLQSNSDPEIRALGKELGLAEVTINKNGVFIGSWIYEEGPCTLTKYLTPDKLYGFDYVLHLEEKNNGWEIQSLEMVEVRGEIP